MIPAILVFMLMQAAAVAPAAEAEDIVVLAQKFDGLQVKVSANSRGEVRSCKVRKPSGDPVLDLNACEAVRLCVGRLVPQKASKDEINDCILAELQARKAAGQNEAAMVE